MQHHLPLAIALTAAAVAGSLAGQDLFPLPATTGSRTALEGSAPFLLPKGVSQKRITDRNSLQGLPASFSSWDMVAFDATSRYVFVPTETGRGCGVFRYDTQTQTYLILMQGNGAGIRQSNPTNWNAAADDFTAFDPCTLTPWNTIIVAEESTGGRLFEIENPLAATGIKVAWRSGIPGVAHEGLQFDKNGTLYFIDESNTGSIYKYVPVKKGDLSVGQTFVLSVDAYALTAGVDPAASWDAAPNRTAVRTGPATWVPMTDANGNALTTKNPYVFVTATGGRDAADELKGTPYGRPEDMSIGTLYNGNEVVYVCVTSENRVYSIELVSSARALVREFVNFDTINLATGTDVNPKQNDPWTSPGPNTETNFNTPDNVAIDAFGSVHIVEDANPGDIWKAFDANRDGVAESIALFASLGVGGSEPTGLIADPNNRYRMIVCIQHPSSGNDALWAFDTNPYPGSQKDLVLYTGVNRAPTGGPGEFVRGAKAWDGLAFEVVSPRGGYDFSTYALFLQAVFTNAGPSSLLPGFWMSFGTPIVVVAGGSVGGLPHLLPPGGARLALMVPPGLSGYSLIAQAIAISPTQNGGLLVFSDATETVLK